MSVAADYRQITGGEARVSEEAFAGEVAGRRALWWAGVPGLDPAYAAPTPLMGAQASAMACAAYVLDAHLPDDSRFANSPSKLTEKFFDWLAGSPDDYDAYLRRLALRLACDISGIPADKVLAGAKGLHGGVT